MVSNVTLTLSYIADPPLPPLGLGFFTNGKALPPAPFSQPNTGLASLNAGGYETILRQTGNLTLWGAPGALNAEKAGAAQSR